MVQGRAKPRPSTIVTERNYYKAQWKLQNNYTSPKKQIHHCAPMKDLGSTFEISTIHIVLHNSRWRRNDLKSKSAPFVTWATHTWHRDFIWSVRKFIATNQMLPEKPEVRVNPTEESAKPWKNLLHERQPHLSLHDSLCHCYNEIEMTQLNARAELIPLEQPYDQIMLPQILLYKNFWNSFTMQKRYSKVFWSTRFIPLSYNSTTSC